jgi:endonuclease/exonuclease/phosphatase family metal-dependent hydrolase
VKIRLLSYNVRYGGSGREAALAATIRAAAPDLVVFQEATDPRVIESLAKATGMPHWSARVGHSTAFMSRIAVARWDWHRPRPCRRAFLEIVPAGTETRLFAVHLSALHTDWMERLRVRELKALLRSIERHQHGFHVLAGDFNTLAPDAILDWRRLPRRLQILGWLGGRRIQWQIVKRMVDAGYADGFRNLHPEDDGFTFPSWDPHVRLDYLFVPGGAMERVRCCEVFGAAEARVASDHLPLMAEVDV